MRNQLGPFSVAAAIVCINVLIAGIASHRRTQNFPVAGIAYNLILIRVAQNRAEHEVRASTFICDSIIECIQLCKTGAIPAELIV